MKPGCIPEVAQTLDLDALAEDGLGITLTAGRSLSGSVLDTSGQGVRWASVAVQALEGRRPRTMWPEGIVPWLIVTDESGRYRFDGLAPGRYEIRAWKGDRVSQQRPQAAAGATGVDVVLPATAGLVGEVRLPPDVAPRGGMRIVYVPVDGHRPRGTLRLAPGVSRFHLSLTGDHWLLAAAPGCGTSRWLLASPDLESDAPLLLFLERPGQLTGTLRDSEGRPVPATRLSAAVVPPDDSAGVALDIWRSTTDGSGAFAIDSLGPGCYRVGALGRHADRWRVRLAPGGSATVDLIRGSGAEQP